MASKVFRSSLVMVTIGALSACGGGGGTSSGGGISVNPVFADGSGPYSADLSDFTAKTFPIIIALGRADPSTGDSSAVTTTGALTVEDANSIRLTVNAREFGGFETYDLTRVGGSTFSGDGLTIDLSSIDGGQAIDGGSTIAAFTGAFGFQTREASLPGGVVNYASSDSTLYVTYEDTYQELENGSVAIAVDFTNGGVTGTMFSGDDNFDLDGSGGDNDNIDALVTLNGSLNGGVIEGTLGGTLSIDLGDNGSNELSGTFSGGSVDGNFFGDNADSVIGAYSGSISLTGSVAPATEAVSGTFNAERP